MTELRVAARYRTATRAGPFATAGPLAKRDTELLYSTTSCTGPPTCRGSCAIAWSSRESTC